MMTIRPKVSKRQSLVRTLAALFVGGAILSPGIAPEANATPYTWTATAAGTQDWASAGNWASSTQFVSGSGNELIFFADSTTNINTTGTRNITTNVPASLALNTLTLNGKGASSGAVVSTINIGTSASTWTIGDGTISIVNLNANQGATTAAGFNYNVAANLVLNQANTLFTGDGTGGVHTGVNDTGFVFSGSIGQAASGYGITKSGSSRLTLSSNSLTFTGPLTVDGGSLFLTGNSAPGFAMTVNSGAILRIGNNTATQLNAGNYAGNISTGTGGTLQLWSTAAQEFSGIISGSGGINKAYGGTLTLSGANTYTGKTQLLPQTTAGFTVNVSSFNSVVGGTASSSLGAPTTVANGTIDIGAGNVAAGVTLNYTGGGETTDRVLNISYNAGALHTIAASGSGLLKFTSAPTMTLSSGTGALTLSGTGSGEFTQAIPQLTAGGLSKAGTGTWTLSGANVYTGPTKVTAGTLVLGNALALQNSPLDTTNSIAGTASAGLKTTATSLGFGGFTGNKNLADVFTTTAGGYGGLTALTLNNVAGTTSTYSGNIIDGATGMTLTKAGTGTQFLSGTLGYTGATNVNAGVLGSNSTFSGAVTVANGAGLAPGASAGAFGTLTISNGSASALTLNGSILQVDVSTASNDVIAVTGTTVLNGTNIVLPNMTTGVAAGPYNLVTYGATTGSGSAVFANGLTTLGNATLAVNAGNIQMTVGAGGLNNSVWVGTTGTWDSGTNWNRNGTPASAFSADDWVTINDSGTTTTITSAAAVSPASLTVDNTTKNYTINAVIAGNTPLVKLGAGTLTLGGATNSYTGGTFIGGGRVGITANANLGDAAGSITFNGGELYITNDFSSARPVTLNAVAGNQVLLQGNADWTNSGAFTGDGGITFRQNPNGATSATLTSSSNTFKGALGIQANNGSMTLIIRSLADSASANGNIVFGASTQSQIFEWASAAGGALTLNNRAIEFAGDGNASGTIRNSNTTNAITINTNSVNSGTGVKTLTLEAAAGPTNVFDGDIGNGTGTVALTKTGAGLWVLSGSNSYSGATTISAGTLAGIGANAFGSTSGISLTGTNTLSLRGDSSTTFANSNVTTTATGPTINVDAATGSTSTKTMTMGTLGTTSTAVSYTYNFTGSNNTSLNVGAMTGPASTATGTVTLSNGIASTGALTLASYTGANTTGGETLIFSGNGNTTVTGNVLKSTTSMALTKSGTGTLTLSGSGNTFDGTMTLSGTTTSAGTLAYASAAGANPITFTATTGFGSTLSYTGSSPLTMSGLITTSALTTGGINFEANGTSPTATINYSNTASIGTSTSTGTRFISLGGANTGENTFAGAINNNTGSGGLAQLAKTGAGKWVLTGNSNFSGGLFVNQGTISTNSIPDGGVNSPLGANTRISLGRDNNDGTLIYTGSVGSTNRDVRIGGPSTASGTGGSTILNDGSGALTFTAATFNPTQTGITFNRTLTLGGSYTGGANTIQGVIQNNTATTGLVGVTKTGAGTWTFTGANTYTGPTNINQGTLIVGDGVSGSLGATDTTVGNTGTLGGSGSIGGTVTVQSGGTWAPGNSIAVQSAGAATFDSGSNYKWEAINYTTETGIGTAGTQYDQIQLSGSPLTITSSATANLQLQFASGLDFTGSFWDSNRTWSIVTGATSTSGAAIGTGNISLSVGGSAFDGGDNAVTGQGFFTTSLTGSSLDLVWMAGGGGSPTFAFTDNTAVTLNVLQGGTGINVTKTIQNNGGATGDATLNTPLTNLNVTGSLTGITTSTPRNIVLEPTSTATSYNGPTETLSVTPDGGNNDISVTINVGNASFAASNTSTTFGPQMKTVVGQNATVGNLSSNSDNAIVVGPGDIKVGTTATIVTYTNNEAGNSNEVVSMAWRSRTAAEGDLVNNPKALLSDVVKIEGMDTTPGLDTGTFLLTMTYDLTKTEFNTLNEYSIATSGELQLAWLDGVNWVNAVDGNDGGLSSVAGFKGISAPTGGLGSWGIDTGGNLDGKGVVWAYLNHNSEFAVIPEPSTLVFGGLALLGFAGLGLRRRRQAKQAS